ncbi:TPA: ABC transporter [Candidatus Sumerlaeota bacterium]|jgi:ABC-2 type transport system ATP-binding protein|nr:ABC transporter [Candidatus Sumerlaeota bacterium]
MSDSPPAISIRNLRKEYGSKVAVQNLLLEVTPGEVFCYLGPNGAGKTTTIKVLTGLLRPTSGIAEIQGFDIQKCPVDAKKLIGYIPDHPYLYEKLTGADFLYFIADMFGIDRKTATRRLDEYFEIFELMEAKDQFIENYSHGMRQKLVFAVSLMHDPKVLIVDEPMVGLDPRSARTLKTLLREKALKNNTAIFLSTHILSIAEELADRVGVLFRGELLFAGDLDEMETRVGRPGTLEEMFLNMTGEELNEEERKVENLETV